MSAGPAAFVDPAERLRLERAVVEARRGSGAELAVAVTGACAAYDDARWRAGVLLAALVGLGLAAFAPGVPILALLAAQAVSLGAGFALTRAGSLRRCFVSNTRLERRARERAEALFATEVDRHHGVLLCVCLFERRVVVVAGEGARAALAPGHRWEALVQPVLDGMARRDLPGGLSRALEACAEALPPGPTRPVAEPAPPRLVWLEDAPLRGH